jgi:hypothetical protein
MVSLKIISLSAIERERSQERRTRHHKKTNRFIENMVENSTGSGAMPLLLLR